MMLDGRMFYFTIAVTIRNLSEVFIKEIKYYRDKEKEMGIKG
jgi:hypothetical protein